jgi:hypothetical protein
VVSFTPRPLYPRVKEPPGTHWVGPRSGLDDVEKRKFLTLPGLEIRPFCLPGRNHSLYRLSYPGSLSDCRKLNVDPCVQFAGQFSAFKLHLSDPIRYTNRFWVLSLLSPKAFVRRKYEECLLCSTQCCNKLRDGNIGAFCSLTDKIRVFIGALGDLIRRVKWLL